MHGQDSVTEYGAEAGQFCDGVSQLDVDFKLLESQYAQRRFPLEKGNGIAEANTSVSFNASIDMASEAHEVLGLKLGRIDSKLGATQHGWLAEQLEKLTHFTRPLVSMAVEKAARKALDKSLAIVREQGGRA